MVNNKSYLARGDVTNWIIILFEQCGI